MKSVIDTNTLIGHILWEDSVPNQAVEAAFRNGVVLRSRNSLFALEQMVMSERFDKYLEKSSREKFLQLFKEITQHVEITERQHFSEEASKNILFELAFNGRADFLITSQRDVLTSNSSLEHTRVISPADFLTNLDQTKETSTDD
jgi:putative PIN family toxin of toxin-antitoxin system